MLVERSDVDALVDLCRGADLVLDCLAFAPDDAAVHGRLVGDVGSVVVVSTASVYRGESGTWLDTATGEDDFPVLPVPVAESHATVDADGDPGYSAQKAALERALLAIDGLPVTILRPGAIHGPHSPALREWFFIKRALDGRERIPLAHRGESRFSTSASVNVAELVRLAGERPGRRVLNAVDDPAPTALEIGHAVLAHLGRTAEFVLLDGGPVDGVGAHPWAVPRPVVLSMEAARVELGYEPVGSHRATIGSAVDWMLDAVRDADWRERFPALATRYGAACWFDYDAEDRLLAR
ncbi:NAD(P)H-binding protein [Microcella alkalica]